MIVARRLLPPLLVAVALALSACTPLELFIAPADEPDGAPTEQAAPTAEPTPTTEPAPVWASSTWTSADGYEVRFTLNGWTSLSPGEGATLNCHPADWVGTPLTEDNFAFAYTHVTGLIEYPEVNGFVYPDPAAFAFLPGGPASNELAVGVCGPDVSSGLETYAYVHSTSPDSMIVDAVLWYASQKTPNTPAGDRQAIANAAAGARVGFLVVGQGSFDDCEPVVSSLQLDAQYGPCMFRH